MTGVRGCIHTDMCVSHPDAGFKTLGSDYDGEVWYPKAGLINCKECRRGYGSESCKRYRSSISDDGHPYAKVIIT